MRRWRRSLKAVSWWSLGLTPLLIWLVGEYLARDHWWPDKEQLEIVAIPLCLGAVALPLVQYLRHNQPFQAWLCLLTCAVFFRELHTTQELEQLGYEMPVDDVLYTSLFAIVLLLGLFKLNPADEALRDRWTMTLLVLALWTYGWTQLLDHGELKFFNPTARGRESVTEESLEMFGHAALLLSSWFASRLSPTTEKGQER